MANHFWLSFDDYEERPARFLGGTVVEANNIQEAVKTARDLEIDPGGEVVAMQIPADKLPELLKYKNRLVHKDELAADGGWITGKRRKGAERRME